MEITQITKYKVDSHEFNSPEDAEAYFKQMSTDKEVFSRNYKLLNEVAHEYAPSINSDGELCLWVNRYNNFDQGNGWEDILNRNHLRYVKEGIKLINSEDFTNSFIMKAEELHIEVENFKDVLSAIRFHLDKFFKSANYTHEVEVEIHSNLLDALGKIHYSPVYIHE
jgi:hypothetical protein